MKSILVATDLSPRSDRAVHRALRIAAMQAIPCHVIAVVDNDVPKDMLARQQNDVAERLERFVRTVAAPDQQVTTAAIAGDPFTVIPEQAQIADAGLVVLGLHRARPFFDFIRDTTMERLVRRSMRPVLLVRDPADHDYAKVLVPVSFSPACAAALRIARTLAPKSDMRTFHAVLTPFSGLTGEGPDSATASAMQAEAAEDQAAWRAAHDPDNTLPETEILTGGRSEIMMRMSADKPDLIAVGAHTRAGYAPYTLGSFVAELIRTPPCDILVARA